VTTRSQARVLTLPMAGEGRGRPFESDRVHAWLRQSILTMVIVPGAALAESEIATRFGTSRTPVREALLRLAEEGLVDIRPQRGTYVSRMNLARLEEALFLRDAVEGAVLRRLAGGDARARVASELTEHVDRHEAAVDAHDLPGTLDGDAAFHRALVQAGGMPGLWDVVGKARDLHHRLRAIAAPEAPNARAAVADHRGIVRAIRSGNADLAHRRLTVHLGRNRGLARALAQRFPGYFD